MTALIRDAEATDADAIGRVHVEGWQSAYRGLLPDSFLDGLDPDQRAGIWRELMAAPPAGWHLMVAEEAGEIVGFATVGDEFGEPLPGCAAHLGALYVRPPKQGRGVGRRLLASACCRALSADRGSLSLWVLEGNDRGEGFYRRLGARELMRADKPGPETPIREIALGWDRPGMAALAGDRP